MNNSTRWVSEDLLRRQRSKGFEQVADNSLLALVFAVIAVFFAALLAAVTAGFLSYLDGSSVAMALMKGGATFAGAFTVGSVVIGIFLAK
ncbi:hypothetical protein [Nonomuraea jabiensis]|uniref:Uncharacterized protein n=1 Tax=Nonomuraea jabiensis TaxID=882448 RepID=A0A7W9LAB9_9ACTN|nr:hypothetical protein [Nonomuraea jabiensis]MBB5776489.1 hypothetical protein [Nonomuraea jabiensis]